MTNPSMNTPVRDNRRPGWGWFNYEVLDDYGALIGAHGLAVYMVLVRFANNETQASWPAIPTIADKTGLSESTVRRTLVKLQEVGLITIEAQHDSEGRQRPNCYTLVHVTNRAVTQTPTGVSHRQGEGVTLTPEQDLVNKTYKNESEAPAPGLPDRPIHPVPKGTPVTQRPDAPPLLPKQVCPATFPVTDAMRAWAATHTPEIAADVDANTGLFVAHYRSKGERRADWAAAWEGFMWRKLEDYRAAHPRATPARPPPLQLTPYQERAAARRAAQAGAL